MARDSSDLTKIYTDIQSFPSYGLQNTIELTIDRISLYELTEAD